jgi:hypothetical protein
MCTAIATGVISTFTANPSRVLSGQSTALSWTTTYMAKCSVTTSEGNLVPNSSVTNASNVPATVIHAEIYTLSCTDNLMNSYSATVNVNLVPQFKEV